MGFMHAPTLPCPALPLPTRLQLSFSGLAVRSLGFHASNSPLLPALVWDDVPDNYSRVGAQTYSNY